LIFTKLYTSHRDVRGPKILDATAAALDVSWECLRKMGNLSSASVFVAGAGPAGLAVSIALRQRGLHVVCVDGANPGADKACGEGLMPDSLEALRSLEVVISPAHGFPFRGIRFVPGIDASFPGGHGMGVRRTVLHQLLVSRAQQVGVELHWNSPLKERDFPSGWVIGADGGNSLVRRWAGLDETRTLGQRYGFRRHYRVEPWSDCVEVHWQTGRQLYITPVGPEEVCVAMIARNPRLRLDDVLPAFPAVSQRLKGAAAVSTERGAATASRSLRRVASDRVALIGDASGSVDAITGEGLCLSFRQAIVLADAVAAGNLEPYQRAHSRLMRRPRMMARLLLSLDRSTLLRRSALRLFAANPALFAGMLAVHVGATDRILPSGWRVLRTQPEK
jgi:flavin-dependent dehydrogenase